MIVSGQKFAMVISKLALAYLILDFSFEACDATIFPIKTYPYSVFYQNVGKICLKVDKIASCNKPIYF